jgi:predicted regulator of Ras-like GTPase activity (Roadblock/LC7/MglB family)
VFYQGKEKMGLETKQLAAILKNINQGNNILGSVLISNNGLIIASELPKDVDKRQFAAMTATMVGSVITAATTLGSTKLLQANIELDKHSIFCTCPNPETILVVVYEIATTLDSNPILEFLAKINKIWP